MNRMNKIRIIMIHKDRLKWLANNLHLIDTSPCDNQLTETPFWDYFSKNRQSKIIHDIDKQPKKHQFKLQVIINDNTHNSFYENMHFF